MPRNIDLFIRPSDGAEPSITELADRIVSAASLRRADGDDPARPVVMSGEVRAELRPNDLTRDDDVVLGRYPWVLTAGSSAAGRLGDAPETRMLREVASGLAPGHAVLLVLDLQYRRRPIPPGGGARPEELVVPDADLAAG